MGMEMCLSSSSMCAGMAEVLGLRRGQLVQDEPLCPEPRSPAPLPRAPQVSHNVCRNLGPQCYGGGRKLRTAVMNSSNLS